VGRLMAYISPRYGLIKHGQVIKIFLGADVLQILIQASGAAMLASRGSLGVLKIGKGLLAVGMALQVITFGAFFIVVVVFDFGSSRAPELRAYTAEMRRLRTLWNAFYVSAFLIIARCTFRMLEFGTEYFAAGSNNPQGYLITHERFMYLFDSIPILISVSAFAVFHPGAYLPSRKGLCIDGTYETPSGGCCGSRKRSKSPLSSTDSLPKCNPPYPRGPYTC